MSKQIIQRFVKNKKKDKKVKTNTKKRTKPKTNHNKLFPITFLPDITISDM